MLFASNVYASPRQSEKKLGKPGTIQIVGADIIYYALEKDTLSTIAKQFTEKVSNWNAIGKLNKIDNDRTIPIGSGIIVPGELLLEEVSQAVVVAIAGVVSETKKTGVESSVNIGSVVLEGSHIRTSKNGFLTLALPDASRVSIPSNSEVSFAKLRMTKFTKSPRTQIKLIQGRVESKVTPLVSNKGRFEVTSPLAIAGVRGTHFRVGMNDNSVANEVLEGGVAVGKKENPNALLIPAGKGNIIDQNGVGKAIDLLPAPEIAGNFQLQEHPRLQFNVHPVPEAVDYRAQISTDDLAQDIVAESFAKDLRFVFDGIDDGRYFIRLTAVDQHHLEGLPNIQAFTLKARPQPPFPLQPKHKVREETTEFKWAKVSGAKFYRLQIASDNTFQHIVFNQEQLTETSWSTSKLTVGNYFWRVASVFDKQSGHDQGPFSVPQTFSVQAIQTMHPVMDTGELNVTLQWPSETGQRFLVEISKDVEFKKLFLSKTTNEASLSIPRPATGIYFVRVRATDSDRFIGRFSQPQTFEIQQRWTTNYGDPVTTMSGTLGRDK